MHSLRPLWIGTLLLLLFPWVALTQTQPQKPRTGPNLVVNPNFNSTTGWFPSSGSTYDTTRSRTADGSGSIRLPPGTRLDIAANIPVSPNTTYTLSAYIYNPTFPPPGLVNLVIAEVNSAGTTTNAPESGMQGNSVANTWQEVTQSLTTRSDTTSIAFIFTEAYPGIGTTPIWIDEVYFGTGATFNSPPTAKTPFNGTDVKIDALGNMEIKKAGVFQPFFPFCIYSDGRRPNMYTLYTNQGFNCDVGGAPDFLDTAAAATSSFNPDGLMIGIGYTVQHTMNEGGNYWDAAGSNIASFGTQLRNHARFHTHFLWYYWDNENVWDQWQNQMTAANQWKAQDVVDGQRTHPFYGLQGSYGSARNYHNPATGETCCDMVGTYSDGGFTGGAGHGGAQDAIWNHEGQTFPVVIEQMNIVFTSAAAGSMRSNVYRYLTSGAKGFGFWRDCYPNDCGGQANDITTVPWWPDVPNIRAELDAMLPMLRQPHWTSWTVALNAAAPELSIGTRDYNGKGHLILNNASTSALTRTFTITGLPYTPTSVVNYFTGSTVTTFSGNSFTVTLAGNGMNSGTAVYRLEGAGTSLNVPVINGALSVVGNVGGPFLYQISATNSPTSYGATPLPSGLSVNTSTGLISGTPTASGTTNVTMSATNADGTGTAALTLSISPSLAPQLLVNWPFDDGSGSTARDATGHGYTGTLIGAPTWGTGLTFNGSTQYVTNTTVPWPANQPITVALWVNTPGGTQGGAFNIGQSGERIGAHIPWSDNILYWDYSTFGTFDNGRITMNFAPYLNTWTHVALVSNSTNFKAIYINGQLVTSGTIASAPASAHTGLEVGRYNVTGVLAWHIGQIRDFRLYTYTLSAEDILALYNANTLPVPLNFRIAP